MTTLEILETARGRIANEERWTGGWGDMSPDGSTGKTCALGAIRTALGRNSRWQLAPFVIDGVSLPLNSEGVAAAGVLAQVIGMNSPWDIMDYNDTHSHECVIAMFDAAIEKERARS